MHPDRSSETSDSVVGILFVFIPENHPSWFVFSTFLLNWIKESCITRGCLPQFVISCLSSCVKASNSLFRKNPFSKEAFPVSVHQEEICLCLPPPSLFLFIIAESRNSADLRHKNVQQTRLTFLSAVKMEFQLFMISAWSVINHVGTDVKTLSHSSRLWCLNHDSCNVLLLMAMPLLVSPLVLISAQLYRCRTDLHFDGGTAGIPKLCSILQVDDWSVLTC